MHGTDPEPVEKVLEGKMVSGIRSSKLCALSSVLVSRQTGQGMQQHGSGTQVPLQSQENTQELQDMFHQNRN